MIALFCAALAAAPPPLEQTADSGALAWLQVPELAPGVAALERSSFSGLLPLLLPHESRVSLAGTAASSLMLALYRGDVAGSIETATWIEAGAAAPALYAQLRAFYAGRGFVTAARESAGDLTLEKLRAGGREVTLFAGAGRCGMSTDPRRAARALSVAAQPLGATRELATVLEATPTAQLRGRVDLQRWYGLLARTRRGPYLSGLVRRLGLDRLMGITVQARIVDPRTLRWQAQALMPRPWSGVAAALGDAIDPVWPAAVPPSALLRLIVSVRPRALYRTLESVLAYDKPLELTLALAQLHDLETRLGKGLATDALGDTPRAWSLYQVQRRGRIDTVLVAEVADGALAGEILGSYAGLASGVFPQLRVARSSLKGTPILTVTVAGGPPLVALAFRDHEIVVTDSKEALLAHLSRRGKPRPIRGASAGAVAYVAQDDAALAKLLLSRAEPAPAPWTELAAAMRESSLDASKLRAGLSHSVGSLHAVADGLRLEVVTNGR